MCKEFFAFQSFQPGTLITATEVQAKAVHFLQIQKMKGRHKNAWITGKSGGF